VGSLYCRQTEVLIKRVRDNYKAIFGKIYNLSDLDLIYPGNRSATHKNWREDWDVTPEASFKKLQYIIGKDEIVIRECKSLRS
jgi:hypothetical protein